MNPLRLTEKNNPRVAFEGINRKGQPHGPRPIDAGMFGTVSPFTMLCKLEFEKAGIRPWTNDELVRCATLLKKTPRELCAMIGVFNETKIQLHWKKNRWPLEMSLQFWKLRRFYMKVRHLDIQDKLVAQVIAAA